MKIKAYAKVNLAIDVLGKDESGYHFVDMIMASIDLHDIVQIESREDEIINITSNLKELPIGKDNICYKAAELIKTKLNISNGFNIHIQKNIPMQAGLGGGSADAAAVLNGINNIYNNKIEYDELLNLACKLGADVSFMLKTGMARATHFGEKLEYFIGLKPLKCILVKPDFGVSTATVYSIIDDLYRNQISNIDEIITNLKKNNVYKLVQLCYNVLEDATLKIHPEINDIKKYINKVSKPYLCMMTGSGSTVFALYDNNVNTEEICSLLKDKFRNYKIFNTILRGGSNE